MPRAAPTSFSRPLVAQQESVDVQVAPESCKLAASMPGHKEDDLLPFKTLLKDQDQEFTNAEMYDMLYPTREELPYVFDSVLYWKACSAGTIAS